MGWPGQPALRCLHSQDVIFGTPTPPKLRRRTLSPPIYDCTGPDAPAGWGSRCLHGTVRNTCKSTPAGYRNRHAPVEALTISAQDVAVQHLQFSERQIAKCRDCSTLQGMEMLRDTDHKLTSQACARAHRQVHRSCPRTLEHAEQFLKPAPFVLIWHG